MLTKRQNFLETIRGGSPDRYVNQYEYLNIVMGTPFLAKYPVVAYGQENVVLLVEGFWFYNHFASIYRHHKRKLALSLLNQ